MFDATIQLNEQERYAVQCLPMYKSGTYDDRRLLEDGTPVERYKELDGYGLYVIDTFTNRIAIGVGGIGALNPVYNSEDEAWEAYRASLQGEYRVVAPVFNLLQCSLQFNETNHRLLGDDVSQIKQLRNTPALQVQAQPAAPVAPPHKPVALVSEDPAIKVGVPVSVYDPEAPVTTEDGTFTGDLSYAPEEDPVGSRYAEDDLPIDDRDYGDN